MKNPIYFYPKKIIKYLIAIPDIISAKQQFYAQNKEQLRLNLGVGPYPIDKVTKQIMQSYGEGWVYIDKYIKQPGTQNYDIRDLPYASQSVDTILASHVLEHIPFPQVAQVLKYWHSLLKPNGQIYLNVPDMEWLCQRFVDLVKANRNKSQKYQKTFFNVACDYRNAKHTFLSALFGTHEHEGEIHHSGFTQESLKDLLHQCGFKVEEIKAVVEQHDVGCLIAKAYKISA